MKQQSTVSAITVLDAVELGMNQFEFIADLARAALSALNGSANTNLARGLLRQIVYWSDIGSNDMDVLREGIVEGAKDANP